MRMLVARAWREHGYPPKRYKKWWGADLRGKGHTVYEALWSIWRDAPAMRGCNNV